MDYVCTLYKLDRCFPGGKHVLKEISLSFLPKAKIGILGTNGAGKSTLLRIIAGLDEAYQGERRLANHVRCGYLPQEPVLDSSLSVRENILLGKADTAALIRDFEEVSSQLAVVEDPDEMALLLDRQADLQERIDAVDGWDLENQARMAIEALRCPPEGASIDALSGGEKRRVALAQLLLSKPELLLLDEPTNHLDAATIAWLEHHLRAYEGTVLMVTHDRYFLDNVADWILELDHGSAYPFKGNYAAWLDYKQTRLAQESRHEAAFARHLARERLWMQQTPQARQSKAKARVHQYTQALSQQNSEARPSRSQIVIPPGDRLGSVVIKFSDVSFKRDAHADAHALIEGASFAIPPGAVVGIIGPNGVGKTTLLRLVSGQERPASGTIELGTTVKLGYVDQARDTLDPEQTVWACIAEGEDMLMLGKQSVSSRAYVSSFNFRSPDQQKKVKMLSGGERNRVHLARILKEGANVLLLDEPTNDLDVETLRALEDALNDFPNSALVVSHDRWFLDRIVTHILAFEGEGRLFFFEGSYQDYVEDFLQRSGQESLEERFKYRKLTRS